MEFRILGPLEVEADGRVLKLGGAQPRALLALLAPPCERGGSAGPLDRRALGRPASGDRRDGRAGARLAAAQGTRPRSDRHPAARLSGPYARRRARPTALRGGGRERPHRECGRGCGSSARSTSALARACAGRSRWVVGAGGTLPPGRGPAGGIGAAHRRRARTRASCRTRRRARGPRPRASAS